MKILSQRCRIILNASFATICIVAHILPAMQNTDTQSFSKAPFEAAKEQLNKKSIEERTATSTQCPNLEALDIFKYRLAYDKRNGLHPVWPLKKLNINIWQCGPSTGFYATNKAMNSNSLRMTYIFDLKNGQTAGGTCPAEQNWIECIENWASYIGKYSTWPIITCTTTIDLRTLPVWKPSPNDQIKKRVAEELRQEIEARWHGIQEIVLQDFNLRDPGITAYLKMPDGDYFSSFSFNANLKPHLSDESGFGMTPREIIRKEIFSLPYKLK
jgi:hypothetical protein